MKVSEYSAYDATGLAMLIGKGEVSAQEVHRAALIALREAGRALNAVAAGPWEEPLAYNTEGRFRGAPFVLKDLSCEVAGVAGYRGSYLTGEGLVAREDCHLMARFRTSGLAAMALATTDELGFGANTSTPRFGNTRNPWNFSISPGGSSGGSAALVSSGAVPLAHASDAGGSLRIPACVTGLVGLKPSRGRIPSGPSTQESHWGLATSFVLSRTVRDAAAVLDETAGPMPGDKTIVSLPSRSWSEELKRESPRYRIGIVQDSWSSEPLDHEVIRVVGETAGVLEQLGHEVERAPVPFDWERMLSAVKVLGCASAAISISRLERVMGVAAEDAGVQPIILSYKRYGLATRAIDIGDALDDVNHVSRCFAALFNRYDVILLPNMTVVQWDPEKFNPCIAEDALDWMDKMFAVFCFNPVFNVTGGPSISVPVGVSSTGTPIGLQLAGGMCNEAALFQISAQLEEVFDWTRRAPPYHAGARIKA